MSRSDEMIVESLIRLVYATCSVRWSLTHWLLKKTWGEPVARAFAATALCRTPYFQKQTCAELKRLPGRDLIRLMTIILPHRSRRGFLKQLKKQLLHQVVEVAGDRSFQEFKEELLNNMPFAQTEYSTGQEPIANRLYPELQVDLNTLCAEPWRAVQAFPMEILKSPREQRRLQCELGYQPDNYARQLISIIWQLANDPNSIGLDPPRSNDLLFQVVEQKPSEGITGYQAARALFRLFKTLGDEKRAKALFEHFVARVLRYQFNLSHDRNVSLFSEIEDRYRVSQSQAGVYADEESWEPEDILSMRGYDDVDYRLVYEALRNQSPPKQKVALDIYLEHFNTGESIEAICARRQLNPVVVRNNFQAVKRKVKVDKI